MTETDNTAGLPVRRLEAMTDGIYAVAMTLLVIDLKVPQDSDIHSAAALAAALTQLTPKFFSWLISFMVLSLFWYGHHRIFSHLRQVTGRLVALNLCQLAVVSLMPFSSALIGEFGGSFLAQVVYSSNMILLAVFSLLLARYVWSHPACSSVPMSRGEYGGAQIRNLALVAVSAIAIGIGYFTLPALGNLAFVLMAIVMPLSRRYERRGVSA